MKPFVALVFALTVASASAGLLPNITKPTALEGVYQQGTLKSLLLKSEAATAVAHTFTIWTKNTGRLWLDFGAPGASPGDQVTAYGQMYETADASGPSVGEFNLLATVTQVTGGTERRLVTIELSFNRGDVPFKAVDIAHATGNKTLNFANVAAAPTNDIDMMGVVTYPSGGAILTDPLVLAVVGGTGAWTGARGTCTISYDTTLQTFKYTVTLLKF